MKLTKENYFSTESQMRWLSVSQVKQFIGTPFKEACPASAIAELKGEYKREVTDSLLMGSYVDMQLTEPEKYEQFCLEHPEMFSSRGATKGELKSNFQKCNAMVERVKRDDLCMKTLKGDKQAIFTGKLFGAEWKVKLDVLGDKYITDIKTVESINKGYYDKANGQWLNFVQYFDYIFQAGLYQEIVRQNIGKKLPFFIMAVSKESTPDIGVFQIDDQSMSERLAEIEPFIPLISAYKKGEVEPPRCEHCDYCKSTKKLSKPLSYLEIGGVLNG